MIQITRQPKLPIWDHHYGRDRPRMPADPIGLRGLPTFRGALDTKLQSLCSRLKAAGPDGIASRRLVADLWLSGTRALRLLVAYGRVVHHFHQIVGVPGDRYYWGDAVDGLYKRAIADNRRRGRCHFFIAALHQREGTAMALVQLVFDFMDQGVPARHNDDLAALVASEGVGVEDVLDAMVRELAGSDEGRGVLARLGRRHANILLPAETVKSIAAHLDRARDELLAAAAGSG